MQRYFVPGSPVETELEIKKSRFIGRAAMACDREQALAQLAQARRDYPDARHHCWAYQIGPPHSPALAAFSDDGEPGGTAGKPILNVLSHKDVGDVMLIVIRYFGGIKLGAGGLVRAYSQAAQMAMDALTLTEFRQLSQARVLGNYSLEQALRHWLSQHEGNLVSVHYGQGFAASVALPDDHMAALAAFLSAHGGQLLTEP